MTNLMMSVESSIDSSSQTGNQLLYDFDISNHNINSFEELFNQSLHKNEYNDVVDDPFTDADIKLEQTLFERDVDHPILLSGSETIDETLSKPSRNGIWKSEAMQSRALLVGKTRKPRSNEKHDNSNDIEYKVSRDQRLLSLSPIPSSKKTKRTKPSFGTMLRRKTRSRSNTSRLREATLSPSPMYVGLTSDNGQNHPGNWQRDFELLNLEFDSGKKVQSSPKDGTTSTAQIPNGVAESRKSAVTRIALCNARDINLPAHNYDSIQLQQPSMIDPALMNNIAYPHIDPLAGTYEDQINGHSLLPNYYTNTVELDVNQRWSTKDIRSSNDSNQTFSTTTYYTDGKDYDPVRYYWSHHVHKPWSEDYPDLAAPKPKRAPSNILRQDYDAVYGLGIDISNTQPMNKSLLFGFESASNPFPGPAVSYPSPRPTVPEAQFQYAPIPPLPTLTYPDFSTFTTPLKHNVAPSRSPSPSTIPTSNYQHNPRQHSPTRSTSTHHRRKSLHKPGPKASTSRSRSSSKPPRTPKTPSRSIDFVNFTPKDSAKLLNDVAPSGSSKTRARREHEARELRKKISEAALKAVKKAGGDVEALEKAIGV